MTTVEPPALPVAIRSAAIGTFRDAAADEGLSRRLGAVAASVAIDLRDHPDDAFVVRLTPGSIGILEEDDPHADIRITMSHADLHEIFAGGLHLPMKIARGDVSYVGPVRHFLRITAILTTMRGTYEARLAEGVR